MDIGVLTKINRREWAAPSFIALNKDGQVRFISDFRIINKQVKIMPYNITHNKDMLNKLSNFTYVTILDMMMGYYDISLTDAAKKVCTITTPFVKYEYNHLLMEVGIVQDIFQERLSALMDD